MEHAQEKVLIEGVESTFNAMYDYEAMLYYPGRLTDYHFYQHNYLLEGHFRSKD